MKLKSRCLLLVGLASACQLLAATPIPEGIQPLKEKIGISFNPTFSAFCTFDFNAADGSTPKSIGEIANSIRVERSAAGQSQLIYTFIQHGTGSHLVFKVSDDGALKLDSPEFRTDGSFDAEGLKTAKENLLQWSGFFIENLAGLRYSTGDLVAMGCGKDAALLSNSSKVVGALKLDSRDAIVYVKNYQCKSQGNTIQGRGWSAIDIQSGLPISGSLTLSKVKFFSEETLTTLEKSCHIEGKLESQSIQLKPSAQERETKPLEQKLLELKSLVDKGLISKELYDLKASELVKSY